MDKETRDMFNMVIEAIDKSEERINKRLDQMATKEELNNMYENLQHEINGVKLHTEALDMRMQCVEEKVDSMDKRLGAVEIKVDSMNATLQSMSNHGPRIQALEKEVFGKRKKTRRALWQL